MLTESPLDHERPIIDPHHHLWDWPTSMLGVLPFPGHPFNDILKTKHRYLLDQLLADVTAGHNIRATVFIETNAMYRKDGPEETQSLGETEFANGIAAMCASGTYGDVLGAAGIVGHVDLRLGERSEGILEQHINVAGGRFRGIRQSGAWDSDATVLGVSSAAPPGLFADPAFRKGFAVLRKLNLNFEAWVVETQLAEVMDLAWTYPDTSIVLNHLGTPLGVGPYAGHRRERFDAWRNGMKDLGRCQNVSLKLGGLAMPCLGFPWSIDVRPQTSAELATAWKPYIDAGVEAFGPARCMFESNFPVDYYSCNYVQLWNAFKRVAAEFTGTEKNELFYGTARRVYRLPLPDLPEVDR
ncbi:MAG TPA: amidohydrolase family protein [Nevskiaceae bacterium]|nr:amidohydrolase family protein [Nevskiaceae bacterium]